MSKKNIVDNIDLMAMIDSQVRLFNRDYSARELLQMDIPGKKALVMARLLNLSRSRQKLEEDGTVDQFTKDDISLQMMSRSGMGGLLS